jgi:hypothetical protein
MKLIKATGLALFALAFHGVASAGPLVDERSHPATAAAPVLVPGSPTAKGSVASATPGRVTGDTSEGGWSEASPWPKSGATLSTAILQLRPDQLPVIEMESTDQALLDLPVTWTVPSSRSEALAQIASRYSVNIAISDTNVAIAKAAVFDPAAPPPKRAYEVKLSDVKLSTTFDRWARESGVSMRWDADKHLLIDAQETFMATDVFDAISQALATPGIKGSEYPLEVCEYPNTPKLLRVTRQGEQIKDCPN